MSESDNGARKSAAYPYSSGGWGSLKAVASALTQEKVPLRQSAVLLKQNKPDGFACVSCSWAKPADPHVFEFCESGAKATAWDLTAKRMTPQFFELHTVTQLLTWHDHDLEEAGRLTAPLRYDAGTDKYVSVGWEEAFEDIGRELRALDPKRVVFYASGRASLETSYMYQLFARMYGTNNLPDSSNMCHESTSVGLKEAIGVGVGTITLDDFEKTDLMFFFGQNVGHQQPAHAASVAGRAKARRADHHVQSAARAGPAAVRQSAIAGRDADARAYADQHAISSGEDGRRYGRDARHLQGRDSTPTIARSRAGEPRVLDVAFIEEHTTGFEAFADYVRAASWDDIERVADLPRARSRSAADEYMRANAVMAHYGMGITQHRQGVQNVRMLCNLLFLRGNIGKPGAGPSPVRGHSNVQGQRTVGITEKPELAPLDKLASQFRFEPPREKGMNTVEAFEAMIDGKVSAVVNLGGNLVRSVPDRLRIEPAWRRLRLTVNVATKLNRSHLVHGEKSYILPCLSRIEIDRAGERRAGRIDGRQHRLHARLARRGRTRSPDVRSEPYIVAELAKHDARRTLDRRLGPLAQRLCAGSRGDRQANGYGNRPSVRRTTFSVLT